MKTFNITTQKQIRLIFWETFPQFKNEYRARKTQNEYSTDVRCSFCDFTDFLHKSEYISEALYNRATL